MLPVRRQKENRNWKIIESKNRNNEKALNNYNDLMECACDIADTVSNAYSKRVDLQHVQ